MRYLPMLLLLFAHAARADSIVTHAAEPTDGWVKYKVSGTVIVEVAVDRNGVVQGMTVLKSHAFLQPHAMAAAASWRFAPAHRDERKYQLTFELQRRITDGPERREVTRPDELTMRVVWFASTVEWLPRDGGRVATKFCPVHRDAMHLDVVPIGYGLLRSYNLGDPNDVRLVLTTRDYWDARNERFPMVRRFVNGGCMVRETTHAEVHYCPACRRAEETWLRQRPHVARALVD